MKFKKLTAVILAVSVAMSASGTVFADTTERETVVQVTDRVYDEGSIQAYYHSSTDIAYPVEGGNIYFDASTGTITDADGSITSAIIPEKINDVTVTSIESVAFGGCSGLTSITIPSSVTSIEGYAFNGCRSLTSITIPSSITSIESCTFAGCSGLTSITIPDSVTSIGGSAFGGCSGLTSITIPSSVTSIGFEAFRACTGLTNITIPSSVTSIRIDAFSGCTGLTSITIPSSITSIESGTFSDCSGLTSISIPSSVTSIGDWAFAGCSGLTSITIPKSVTSIGEDAFHGCESLTSITIPKSVTSIGECAFEGCTDLTSITIPDSITSIEFGVFRGCSSLPSIIIPDSVTSIEDYAFDGCSSLASITIPSSVTSIGIGAFVGCTGLTSINVDKANTNYLSLDGILFNKDLTELMRLPSGRRYVTYTIPSSVTSIGYSAFSDCSSLTSITIPSNVTSIEEYAFKDCTGLVSLTIPSSVTNIDDLAFDSCDRARLVMCVEAGSYAEKWAKPRGYITSVYQPTETSSTETTETTTETTTEPATEYVTVFGKAYTPDAVIAGGSNVIDYSHYADKEIIVHYNISNVEDTAGIYSYNTMINYNPDVVEMTGVYLPTSLENYATYSDDIGNEYLPYDKDTINALMNMVPQATDDRYADLLTSPGAVNELTAAQLGRVALSNSTSTGTSFTSGTLASFVFKVKGEGDTGICADFDYYGDNTFGVVYNPNIVTSFESLPANIIVKDIDDELNNNGNINLDESISANDAAMLLQKALDLTFKTHCEEAYPDTYISISDVNGDGIITAADSASILQRTLDSSYKFAID